MNKQYAFILFTIIIFIIWTWAITPLWVNIVVTVLASLGIVDSLGDD